MPKKDTFETWKDNGKWPEYREILRKGAVNHYTEKEIASCLNISQDTFTRIKKKHPEILNEMDDARRKDREDLIDAMRKLALGQAKTISKRNRLMIFRIFIIKFQRSNPPRSIISRTVPNRIFFIILLFLSFIT